MRHIRLAAFIVLSVLTVGMQGNVYAQEASDPEKFDSQRMKGSFTISLTEHSPLSAAEEFARRLGSTEAGLEVQRDRKGKQYDTTRETYQVYVPRHYQPGTPYGLLVWLDQNHDGTVPPSYKPVLDKHRLIWISPNRAGNYAPAWYRISLALDAAHHIKEQYTIDSERVYVGGHTRGSRTASVVAIAYPELFYGGLFVAGCNYFKKIPVPSKPGFYYSNIFKTPPPEALEVVKKRNRYVLFTGSDDPYREQMKTTYEHYKGDGFQQVTCIDIPGKNLANPDAEQFKKIIPLLDGEADSFPITESAELKAKIASRFKQMAKRGEPFGVEHLAPGVEIRIDAPEAKNTFLVYVPTDYTPEPPWPIIFSYHGRAGYGSAGTELFRRITHGTGFVIVGMNYATG